MLSWDFQIDSLAIAVTHKHKQTLKCLKTYKYMTNHPATETQTCRSRLPATAITPQMQGSRSSVLIPPKIARVKCSEIGCSSKGIEAVATCERLHRADNGVVGRVTTSFSSRKMSAWLLEEYLLGLIKPNHIVASVMVSPLL